ncbi:MAG: aspartate aminotransferase family protein, partial [Deltaproteobacteria bacterium CG_4_10_14_0_2_um_filter_43_8]
TQYGTLLIFDEVMTGFRVALGGAQSLYNITPDITCLGKVIGGGLPVGAYGGKREIMRHIAPLGPVYQAGTLSGNPLAMAAGIETLKKISAPKFFEQLISKTQTLTENISAVLTSANIAHQMHRVGSMWSVFFSADEVRNFTDAAACDQARFKSFFHFLLEHGIYIAPSAFESAFMSIAHSDEDIEQTISVIKKWCETHA